VLLLGAEVDAEVERARQLQAGLEAEQNIQLPPRSTAKVEEQKQSRDKLEAEGRALRETHTDAPTAEQGSDGPSRDGHGPRG
jgi:membrane protein